MIVALTGLRQVKLSTPGVCSSAHLLQAALECDVSHDHTATEHVILAWSPTVVAPSGVRQLYGLPSTLRLQEGLLCKCWVNKFEVTWNPEHWHVLFITDFTVQTTCSSCTEPVYVAQALSLKLFGSAAQVWCLRSTGERLWTQPLSQTAQFYRHIGSKHICNASTLTGYFEQWLGYVLQKAMSEQCWWTSGPQYSCDYLSRFGLCRPCFERIGS